LVRGDGRGGAAAEERGPPGPPSLLLLRRHASRPRGVTWHAWPMFHLELRQFPHVARAFNLTREELDLRFARPWVGGETVVHDDRRWSPERARLTILEGPELRVEEIGLGRGWATAGRSSRDVTDSVLAEAKRGAQGRPAVEGFKSELRVAAIRRALSRTMRANRSTIKSWLACCRSSSGGRFSSC